MTVGTTLRRLPHAAWLMLVWIALWGNFSVANVLSGVVVVGLVTTLFADAGPRPVSSWRVVDAVRFLGFFTHALVVSTFQVARRVLDRTSVQPGIIAYTMHDVSDAVITLVADAITLTPGTMTLDIRSDGENAVLYIHVFDLLDEEGVRAGLDELRELAVRAFGGQKALDRVQESTT